MLSAMAVFGTRPEAIKVAPVVLAMRAADDFRCTVVVTAQHRDLLDQVLGLFDITPDADLDIIHTRQTLTGVTVRGLEGLDPTMSGARPDVVLVQGDTTTTFVGALCAFYHDIPVAHIEAGLRTHDLHSPYPEEANRQLTSRLATLHLAPTATAKANLLAEGIPAGRIVVTGNTVIDALDIASSIAPEPDDRRLAQIEAGTARVILVTLHRRESWGAPMAGVADALAAIAEEFPDVEIVFPVHPNPVVRDVVEPALGHLGNVALVEPLPYGNFARLLARACLVVTDSGGIQEEAPSLGKPVLVTRDTTERPEAVEAGTVRVVGTDRRVVERTIRHLLTDIDAYRVMATAVNPYGDGRATGRTLAALRHTFAGGAPADEFAPETSVPAAL